MESSPNTIQATIGAIRRSHMVRLFAVAFLALVLQIPIVMIGGLIGERQQRRDAAVAEVSGKWGKTQSIIGPALVVPYTHRWEIAESDGRTVSKTERRYAVILPSRLTATGRLATEVRSRGIFSIPVYRADVTLKGEFTRPQLDGLGIAPDAPVWAEGELAVGISDARAIQSVTSASWNGRELAFMPGSGRFPLMPEGIHAAVDAKDAAGRFAFSIPLQLNGSLGLYLAPFGESTVVDLGSNSPNPSFQGAWLPSRRTIGPAGFDATWEIGFLGRNYPQLWSSPTDMGPLIEASRFGVDLVSPVDQYRMAERSVKYASLFILLTFATVWLIEVLAGIQVHPIQYLLLGAALCLFYLLEISLAEHLGFPAAYALASAAVVIMVGAYSLVMLRRPARASIVGLGVAALYGYLYVLLMNEDYALLIGSVGLFLILAAVMFVTRRVDWFNVGKSSGTRPGSP